MTINNFLVRTGVLIAAVGLLGCEGDTGIPPEIQGAGGGGGTNNAIPGIWQGSNATPDPTRPEDFASSVTALISAERIMMVGDGIVYDGNYDSTTVGGRIPVQRFDDRRGATNSLEGTGFYSRAAPLEATASRQGTSMTAGLFPAGFPAETLNFSAVGDRYNRFPAISTLLGGTWTFTNDLDPPNDFSLQVTVAEDGTFTGSDSDGCIYSGDGEGEGFSIAPAPPRATPDLPEGRNMYDVRMSLVGTTLADPDDPSLGTLECGPFGGTYDGLASLIRNDNTLFLVLTQANNDPIGNGAFSFELEKVIAPGPPDPDEEEDEEEPEEEE